MMKPIFTRHTGLRVLLFGFATLVMIRAHGDDADDAAAKAFFAECSTRAAALESAQVAVAEGREGWLFLAGELEHVAAGKFWEDIATPREAWATDLRGPLPAIVDFAAQLKALGIELLLVPVPPKVAVYPDKLNTTLAAPSGRGMDPYHAQFYTELKRRGVKVLDLSEELLAAREQDAAEGPVYCRQDTHWAPRSGALAARRIREAIGEPDWIGNRPRQKFVTGEEETVVIAGDLLSLLKKPDLVQEAVRLHRVGVGSPADPTPVEPDTDSPVLLLADSHGLVFHAGGDMHASGAGLPDHLAAAFGFPVDLLARRGSGATSVRIDLARKFYRDPAYRDGKKLVIWCFAAREFADPASWRMIPMTRAR